MYLLDANAVIDLFKGRGRVAERMLATPPGEIGLASVVLYELEVGAAKSKRPEAHRRQIEELARLARFVPFGQAEARSAARIRAALEAEGRKIGPYDTLIAGTAMAHRAVLVTHNTRELGRIDGLVVEDWL
jgi:tRNA(fMet)-specific endonuclease VapC